MKEERGSWWTATSGGWSRLLRAVLLRRRQGSVVVEGPRAKSEAGGRTQDGLDVVGLKEEME